jgi:hypothetical protein
MSTIFAYFIKDIISKVDAFIHTVFILGILGQLKNNAALPFENIGA